MTTEQIENLKKLSAYLKSGNLKASFSMYDYAQSSHLTRTTCGSVGCAVGHAPFVGIEKFPNEAWGMYSVRVFGINNTDLVWDFLFSAKWVKFDNTSLGASLRIDYYLEFGDSKIKKLCDSSGRCFDLYLGWKKLYLTKTKK